MTLVIRRLVTGVTIVVFSARRIFETAIAEDAFEAFRFRSSHLNLYALAAGGAGVGMLGLAQPAEATIIHYATSPREGPVTDCTPAVGT